ncbi:M24 family metallopeptidase [Streptomyces pseudogriseolus]|uniref:M24 family metallopeptidase n=1 Tax=Streptomyces pseudogriseolus TaxID=36817 RepID=UPI003FA32795
MSTLVVPTYSMAERDRRWNLACSFMDEHGFDALIVAGEHEDAGPAPFYFDTWFTNDRPGTIVVFPRQGDPISLMGMPTFINDHMDAALRGDVQWFAPEQVRAERYSGGIAEVLNEKGLAAARIGVVGLEPYLPFQPEGFMPYGTWKALLEQFPGAEFVAVYEKFAKLVFVLGEEELAAVRHSAAIGEEMAQAMVAAAAPGVSEAEVYAAGMAVAHRAGAIPPAMHFRSGPEPAGWGPVPWAYRPQAPRILAEGDVIVTETFCRFGMRDSQHQLTIAVGDVHEDFERAARIARACYDAGMAALKPGNRFGEVADAMYRPIDEAGAWVRGPQIHALNPFGPYCGFPVDFSQIPGSERYRQSPPAPTGDAEMVLEPGMTFAFEPSCGFGRRVVTLGGTVIVTDDGPEELNPFTAQLLHAD